MKKTSVSLLVFALFLTPAFGAVKIVNTNAMAGRVQNATQYQNVATMQASAAAMAAQEAILPTPDETSLPVTVEDPALAATITNDPDANSATIQQMNQCATIYMGGKFAWGLPNMGFLQPQTVGCTALVELRQIYGANDIVLARAAVAAGDSFVCNISSFPESGRTDDAGRVVFPPDKEPTIDDVTELLNKEQKKNAGLKTVAGTIVGALGGALATEKKSRVKGAAIGAVAAGGLTYASTQTGKVAGDTIMGAGMDAAFGGALANMMGAGRAALYVRACDVGASGKCLWGTIQTGSDFDATANGATAWLDFKTGTTYVCTPSTDTHDLRPTCRPQALVGYSFQGEDIDGNPRTYYSYQDLQYEMSIRNTSTTYDSILGLDDVNTGAKSVENNKQAEYSDTSTVPIIPIKDAKKPGQQKPVAIIDWDEKILANAANQWQDYLDAHDTDLSNVYQRNGDTVSNKPYVPVANETLHDFIPMYEDASSGQMIDLNNRARLGSTLIGAGAGAALGGFASYQGATQEIQDRWVQAVTDYKDSLQKFYCATGTKATGSYNDTWTIPTPVPLSDISDTPQ